MYIGGQRMGRSCWQASHEECAYLSIKHDSGQKDVFLIGPHHRNDSHGLVKDTVGELIFYLFLTCVESSSGFPGSYCFPITEIWLYICIFFFGGSWTVV